jgi:hypothetical protein
MLRLKEVASQSETFSKREFKKTTSQSTCLNGRFKKSRYTTQRRRLLLRTRHRKVLQRDKGRFRPIEQRS